MNNQDLKEKTTLQCDGEVPEVRDEEAPKESRSRTPTEKGKMYQINLLERNLRALENKLDRKQAEVLNIFGLIKDDSTRAVASSSLSELTILKMELRDNIERLTTLTDKENASVLRSQILFDKLDSFLDAHVKLLSTVPITLPSSYLLKRTSSSSHRSKVSSEKSKVSAVNSIVSSQKPKISSMSKISSTHIMAQIEILRRNGEIRKKQVELEEQLKENQFMGSVLQNKTLTEGDLAVILGSSLKISAQVTARKGEALIPSLQEEQVSPSVPTLPSEPKPKPTTKELLPVASTCESNPQIKLDSNPHDDPNRKINQPVSPDPNVLMSKMQVLFGNNCPQTLCPLEELRGCGHEPFGVRTGLGCGVIEPKRTYNSKEIGRPASSGQVSVKEVLNLFEKKENLESLNYGLGWSVNYCTFISKVETGPIHRPDNHYEMPDPFKSKDSKVPNNNRTAEARLRQSKNKFRNVKFRKDYNTFVGDMLAKGYEEKATDQDIESGRIWFLPYHGEYQPKKSNSDQTIKNCSAPNEWHRTKEKVANLASRSAEQIKSSRWILGPECLWKFDGFIGNDIEGSFEIPSEEPEVRKDVACRARSWQWQKRRWCHVQHLTDEFWCCWKNKFLQSPQQRKKWQHSRTGSSPPRSLNSDDIASNGGAM